MNAVNTHSTIATVNHFIVSHEGVEYTVKVTLVGGLFDNVEISADGELIGYQGDDGILRDEIEDYLDKNWDNLMTHLNN